MQTEFQLRNRLCYMLRVFGRDEIENKNILTESDEETETRF